LLSLIAKPALAATVRACPGNPVTGHAPEILLHAIGTYLETTSTSPAEEKFLLTQMTKTHLLSSSAAAP
jgi:hypothetical protein